MTLTAPDAVPSCPTWCPGHEDDQEPTPARWHRSDGIVVSVVERRSARLGGDPATLVAEDHVVAIEQDAQATYPYVACRATRGPAPILRRHLGQRTTTPRGDLGRSGRHKVGSVSSR
ncbi:DUF6907 domain-containing protein [Microbacterium testaceum]|uniref:DUF6907 domain-containing protein n=1 Tax=Microbacterium testaceum TaxID=2033 RepID=UPI003F54FBF1